jgi:hypothetical protein
MLFLSLPSLGRRNEGKDYFLTYEVLRPLVDEGRGRVRGKTADNVLGRMFCDGLFENGLATNCCVDFSF